MLFVVFNTKIEKTYMVLISAAPLLIVMMVLLPYPAIAIEPSNGIVINPNTNKIYVFNGDGKSVSVIDGRTDKVVMNVPVGKTNASILNIDSGMVVQILGISAGIITGIVGIVTYHHGVITAKKETLTDIIFPLVKEFDNDSQMKMAKMILDGIPISLDNTSPDMPYGYYDEQRLLRTLGDHHKKIKWDNGDAIVRGSFDSLLNFFHKLESQFIAIPKLVTREELNYFDYYINRAAENKAVINYVRIYKFPLYGNLHRELDYRLPSIDTGANIEKYL